jgi:hypothetical protein
MSSLLDTDDMMARLGISTPTPPAYGPGGNNNAKAAERRGKFLAAPLPKIFPFHPRSEARYLPTASADVYKYPKVRFEPHDHAKKLHKIRRPEKVNSVAFEIDKKPFAAGAVRFAFHGKYKIGSGEWVPTVFKTFHKREHETWDGYVGQMEISTVSVLTLVYGC